MARILIIEDEIPIAILLKRIISAMGHEVFTAGDGATGLRFATTEALDLILSDLTLPGQPAGMELIRELRGLKPQCHMIILTGRSAGEFAGESQALGIKEILTKPFEMTEVRSLVTRVLGTPG